MAKKQISAFTAEERRNIADLRRQGHSARDVAERFGTSNTTISKIYQLEVFR